MLVYVVDRRKLDLAHKDKLSMNAMFTNVAGLPIVVIAMFQIATILGDEPSPLINPKKVTELLLRNMTFPKNVLLGIKKIY